jgi:hypothetical protein
VRIIPHQYPYSLRLSGPGVFTKVRVYDKNISARASSEPRSRLSPRSHEFPLFLMINRRAFLYCAVGRSIPTVLIPSMGSIRCLLIRQRAAKLAQGLASDKSEHHYNESRSGGSSARFLLLVFFFCLHVHIKMWKLLLVSAAIPLLVLVWDSRGQAQSWVVVPFLEGKKDDLLGNFDKL